MAKGKFKAKRESIDRSVTIEQLAQRIKELEEENSQLKEQAHHDHAHHVYQISQMHERVQKVTSPKIERLEAEILQLKKALRGA